MKLKNSKEFTKQESRMIIYYTITQAVLGVMLITLQLIFFYLFFKKIGFRESVPCSCPMTITNETIEAVE